ncbi:MAG: FadR family transcriptional regulator [Verrucomicrobiaceae bacterium]|nr:FadR family transcriptional regulator [Verrucomicrobiaceae bacterium]
MSVSLVESVSRRMIGLARNSGANGRLPTERHMSSEFGVSRSVIREAAKRLELQGLLEIRQGSGMKVVDKLHKPLSAALNLLVPNEKDRLKQLIEVRLALEPENAKLAAERATDADLAALKAHHAAFELAESFEEQVNADMAFHCQLAEASGNQIAALLIQSLSELLQTSLSHGYRRTTKDRAVQDHRSVLNAILSRNPAAAAAAMSQHIAHARNDLGL